MKGETGTNLLSLLERRLDNVVYRLGFASTRAQARQMVNHAHFLVNNRKCNYPSAFLNPGDVVQVRDKSKKLDIIMESMSDEGIMPEQIMEFITQCEEDGSINDLLDTLLK